MCLICTYTFGGDNSAIITLTLLTFDMTTLKYKSLLYNLFRRVSKISAHIWTQLQYVTIVSDCSFLRKGPTASKALFLFSIRSLK